MLDAARSGQDTYNQNAGNIQGLTDSLTGSVFPELMDRFQAGDVGVNAARDYGTSVLGGDYLTQNNPYFSGMLDNALNKSTNATQAALGKRGLTGGSDYAGIIADRNAQVATGLSYNDYSRERAAQDAAAGRAGSIAAADYLPISGLLSTLQASQAPIDAYSRYANSIGGLFGGYGTQTQPGGWGTQLLGAASTLGGAALMSERRVKRDIEQIGAMPDGLGIYRYNYVFDAPDIPVRYGVMRDEVEKIRPWALGPIIDGVGTVDYSKL